MKRATREWVRKAEKDYRFAARNARADGAFYDQLCFHYQQSAEKYLKALLEELGIAVTKTHDLDINPDQKRGRRLRRWEIPPAVALTFRPAPSPSEDAISQ